MQKTSISCMNDELRILEQMLKSEADNETSDYMHEFLRSQTKFFQSFETENPVINWNMILSPVLSSLED